MRRLAKRRIPAGIFRCLGAAALLSIALGLLSSLALAQTDTSCEPTPEYVRGYDHTGGRWMRTRQATSVGEFRAYLESNGFHIWCWHSHSDGRYHRHAPPHWWTPGAAPPIVEATPPPRVDESPGPPGSDGRSTPTRARRSSEPSQSPPAPQASLDVSLTVPEGPAQVDQTLSYTVTVSNTGNEPLTGVVWRDVTSETAAQSLGNLGVGASTAAQGSFGPLRADHVPSFVLTVAVDSDQTDERVASARVPVVAAPPAAVAESTPSISQQPSPEGVPSQQPEAESQTTVTRVPSSLKLRVVRVRYDEPDVHLAHNIPDLLLELPDGSTTTCNFLTHYEGTGGLTRWGYTTSEVLEERPGSLTQYYQRGVVDCHERDGVWLMGLRLAWDHFGGGIDGSADLGFEPHLLSDQPGQMLGPWGHRVSDYAVDGTYTGFLDFFTALGGVPSFGYPKSEARYDNDPRRELGIAVATEGFIRQYFQAAVMEFHPDTLTPVMLRLLGDDLRNRRYPNELYKRYSSFGSVPPLQVGQVFVAENVSASPVPAPPLGTPATSPPATPSSVRASSTDRVACASIASCTAARIDTCCTIIPDLTHILADGSEQPCNFLSYYEATHGLERWGHAISEVLVEYPETLTQYYQRGFLDFFTALGGIASFGYPKTDARYDDDPQAVLRIPSAVRGVIRQYFQAAVLEYHPDDPAQPVKIYLLGHDLRDWRSPAFRAFVAFSPFGPLTQGQDYFPARTADVVRPAG